jgi:hypothetical protein
MMSAMTAQGSGGRVRSARALSHPIASPIAVTAFT